MEHFRLRKYRGPEVWARVRLAYEAGESGPSVAQRFDIGLANLRKKCRLEGWSRRHQAERSDRELPGERLAAAEPVRHPSLVGTDNPVDRQAALAACLDHAAAAMARGDGPKALAALKAARAYTELTGQLRDPEREAEREEARWNAIEALCQIDAVRAQARDLAERMLAERFDGRVGPQSQAEMVYHWRADHLGPEVAARDHADGVANGSASTYWDETGALKPREPELFEGLRLRADEDGDGDGGA